MRKEDVTSDVVHAVVTLLLNQCRTLSTLINNAHPHLYAQKKQPLLHVERVAHFSREVLP